MITVYLSAWIKLLEKPNLKSDFSCDCGVISHGGSCCIFFNCAGRKIQRKKVVLNRNAGFAWAVRPVARVLLAPNGYPAGRIFFFFFNKQGSADTRDNRLLCDTASSSSTELRSHFTFIVSTWSWWIYKWHRAKRYLESDGLWSRFFLYLWCCSSMGSVTRLQEPCVGYVLTVLYNITWKSLVMQPREFILCWNSSSSFNMQEV